MPIGPTTSAEDTVKAEVYSLQTHRRKPIINKYSSRVKEKESISVRQGKVLAAEVIRRTRMATSRSATSAEALNVCRNIVRKMVATVGELL